jgi:hypothetical protein
MENPAEGSGISSASCRLSPLSAGYSTRQEIKSEIDLIVFMSLVFRRQPVVKVRVRTMIGLLQI